MTTPPTPANAATRDILTRRANALAARDASAGAAHEILSVLVARRGEVSFAVRASDVRDVRRDARVTPLPGADRPVVGLVAWRGNGLVVHDVLGGAALAPAPGGTIAPWLLVAGDRGSELALLADDVDDLVDLPLDSLVPAPDGAPPSHGATVGGVLVLDLRGWLALHSAS